MAASNPSCFSVLYLDEFSRLSRRLIETLIFMETAKSHNIEVVSVTQRFDPTTPMGKMLLSLLGEMAENSSRETADRCERGHDHAWRVTKTSVKHPALGYLRVVARDTNGQPLLGANQKQLYREDIDPDTAPFVKMAFLLRAQKLKSRMEIARLFNTHNVGGRNRWGDSCIRQLFQRRDYIGVEVHASTKTVRHPQTGVSKRIPQPENLWKTRLMPHKRIISDELFNAVQLIEKQVADSFTSKFKGPRRARNELHATTPLSGVLICG
jgi:DNA invertase Pin-like site-specific DNA recombinase